MSVSVNSEMTCCVLCNNTLSALLLYSSWCVSNRIQDEWMGIYLLLCSMPAQCLALLSALLLLFLSVLHSSHSLPLPPHPSPSTLPTPPPPLPSPPPPCQAPIISSKEYKHWRATGLAFQLRWDAPYESPNRTLASGLIVQQVQ